jgi:hypothetical protein
MADFVQGAVSELIFGLGDVASSDWEGRRPKIVIFPIEIPAHEVFLPVWPGLRCSLLLGECRWRLVNGHGHYVRLGK